MPKFKFRLARDLTESTDVVIEADNIDEAQTKALEDPWGHEGWETDDCSASKPYLPDERTFEEVAEDSPLRQWRLDVGDSTAGPIGLCAVVTARSVKDALNLFQEIPELVPVQISFAPAPGQARFEYINIYISPSTFKLKDIEEISEE